MTQSIESMIEVLQAYKDGKKIEYLSTMDGTWSSCIGEPLFNFDDYQYRVAPEPKKRVKLEAWIMPSGCLVWWDARKVTARSTDCIRVPSLDMVTEI